MNMKNEFVVWLSLINGTPSSGDNDHGEESTNINNLLALLASPTSITTISSPYSC